MFDKSFSPDTEFMPTLSFPTTLRARPDKVKNPSRRVAASAGRWLAAVAVAATVAIPAGKTSAIEEAYSVSNPDTASEGIKVFWPVPSRVEWENSAEAAVLRALEWLRLNQSPDGAWSNSENPADRVAFASLGLLAFLAHGDTTVSERYGETVMHALKFLLAGQNEKGEFVSTGDRDGTCAQAMAVYAVGEAYGMMRIPALRPAMERGLQVLIDGQHDRGGFAPGFAGSKFGDSNGTQVRRRLPRDRRDTLISAWCCQAMKAARAAGASNPGLAEAMEKAAADLLRAFCPDDGSFFSDGTIDKPGGRRDFNTTAMAVWALQLLGHGNDKEVRQGLQHLQEAGCNWEQPGEWAMQGWYFITKAKYFAGGASWTKWRNADFTPQFVHRQTRNENPAEHGSWVSPGTSLSEGHEGREDFGRAYATALAAMTLQNHWRRRPPLEDHAIPEDGEGAEIRIF